MAYFTNLYTPATYEAFSRSDRMVSGFRESQKKMADRLRPGDVLIGYMTGVSRWVGLYDIDSEPFIDHTPIFVPDDDPFIVRFRVKPRVFLARDHTMPIQADEIWSRLSFTREVEKGGGGWIGPLRRSLQSISDEDGQALDEILSAQAHSPQPYPIDDKAWQRMLPATLNRGDRTVEVTVPSEDEPDPQPSTDTPSVRESHQIQAELARLGEAMGFRVWIPKNDRAPVLSVWDPDEPLMESLPLNYDETTIQTIERIDVLWLKRRSIARAFEVEHTTAIYSGILRMADLLALQPNINIRLHIVAPEERKQKVFDEIRRPVFSLLDHAPLAETCTFLSYDSINEIKDLKHLQYISDAVLEEFEEQAQ